MNNDMKPKKSPSNPLAITDYSGGITPLVACSQETGLPIDPDTLARSEPQAPDIPDEAYIEAGLLTAMGLIAEVQPNGRIGINFSPAFAKQMEAEIAAALEARFGPPKSKLN